MNLTIFYLLFAIQRLKFTFSLNFVLLFRPTDEIVGSIFLSANAPMFVPSKYLCMKNNGEGLDEQFAEDRFIVSDTRITTIWTTMKSMAFISMMGADLAYICPSKSCDAGHCLLIHGSPSTGSLLVGSGGDLDVLKEAAKYSIVISLIWKF